MKEVLDTTLEDVKKQRSQLAARTVEVADLPLQQVFGSLSSKELSELSEFGHHLVYVSV